MSNIALRRTLGACAASLIALAAGQASAATVTFTNITGGFFGGVLTNPLTAPPIAYTGAGTTYTTARWGAGTQRSGYNFATAGTIATSATPPSPGAVVTLGTFQHVNFPISSGTSINAMSLDFFADVDVDGTSMGNRHFVYQFAHEETPNGDNPCAYGGANNQGVNINGCADHVAVNFNSQSDFFDIGGVDYTLDVVGFVLGSGLPVTSFLTVEGQTNTAFIIGRLTPYAQAVPEPASWAMLIAGFGLTGAVARRRRSHVVAA